MSWLCTIIYVAVVYIDVDRPLSLSRSVCRWLAVVVVVVVVTTTVVVVAAAAVASSAAFFVPSIFQFIRSGKRTVRAFEC